MPNPFPFSSSFGNMLSFGSSFCASGTAHAVGVVDTPVKPSVQMLILCLGVHGFMPLSLVGEFCIFKTICEIESGSYSF